MKILEIENNTKKILAVHGDYQQETLNKIRLSQNSYFESTTLDTTNSTIDKTFENGNIVDIVTPKKTLNQVKKEKINEVQQAFSDHKKLVESKYLEEEYESFDDQKKDALAYERDNNAPTPILSRMARGNEEFRLALIQAILSNIDEIAGEQGKMVMRRDAIKSSSTIDEIDTKLQALEDLFASQEN